MPSSNVVRREAELDHFMQALCGANCVSIVGLSNMGKSMLLRMLDSPEFVTRCAEEMGRESLFVYVDCNGMVELSGQGFYELVLRRVQESIADLDPDLLAGLAQHYHQIVEPETPFLVPLSFNNAMTALIEGSGRSVILLLDEFDETFDALDGRVFLNLRALRDRYPRHLIYVTATVRRLGSKRSDEQTAEFVELSAAHTIALRPLSQTEADALAVVYAQEADLLHPLTADNLDFLWTQTGGHPGLLSAAISRLSEIRQATPEVEGDLVALADALARDASVRAECLHLWSQLGPDERETLLAVVVGTLDNHGSRPLQWLDEWGMLRERDDGVAAFSDLMADFVRRQATVQRELPGGVAVDADAGDAWVDGKRVEGLTELEFKLLALLYERANKLTDKYQIVEAVWGAGYIDEVDDTRIEKLVSRLRSKIEPDPANPRYLVTVRGRGYKLNNAG
jgi:hypothetical protein